MAQKKLKQNDLANSTSELGILNVVNKNVAAYSGITKLQLRHTATLDDGTKVVIEGMTPEKFKAGLNNEVDQNKIEYNTPGESYIYIADKDQYELDGVVRKYNDNYVNRDLLIEVVEEDYVLPNGYKVGDYQKDVSINLDRENDIITISGVLDSICSSKYKILYDIDGNQVPMIMQGCGFLFFRLLNKQYVYLRGSRTPYHIVDNIYCYTLPGNYANSVTSSFKMFYGWISSGNISFGPLCTSFDYNTNKDISSLALKPYILSLYAFTNLYSTANEQTGNYDSEDSLIYDILSKYSSTSASSTIGAITLAGQSFGEYTKIQLLDEDGNESEYLGFNSSASSTTPYYTVNVKTLKAVADFPDSVKFKVHIEYNYGNGVLESKYITLTK